jgi:hypothetical protein
VTAAAGFSVRRCRNPALSRVMVQAAHDASPEPMTEDRDEIHADDLSQRG